LCALCLPARGTTVDSLISPTNIQLPNDGNLYAFQFTITITPGVNNAAGGFFPVVFQDSVLGQTQFDWANLVVPANDVGVALTYMPTLGIGCTNSPTPNVFGPLGTFNNAADTAEYAFPTQNAFQGAVFINCNIVGNEGPPFVPSASDPEELIPYAPPAYDPYSPQPNDLLPNNYLDAGSGLNPTDPTPEPATGWLLVTGLGVCAFLSRSRWKLKTISSGTRVTVPN
jgi:hypothetical protein